MKQSNQLVTINKNELAIQDFESLISRFIMFLDVKPKSAQTYATNLKQFERFLQRKGITKPQRDDVIEYREELKAAHKSTTVQAYITAVKLFFQWTETEGIYPDITRHLKGAKITRTHKKDALTVDQVQSILQAVDRSTMQGARDYAILCLMITGGLRDIEIHRANVEDLRTVGLASVLYVQGKGQDEKADYIKIGPETEQAIREYLTLRNKTEQVKNDQPLFTSLSNNSTLKRLSTRSISGIAKNYLRLIGLDSERLTAHSLRHTAVTLALIGGATLQEASQFARHSDISTTQIYAHNLERANNKCGEIIAGSIFKRSQI